MISCQRLRTRHWGYWVGTMTFISALASSKETFIEGSVTCAGMERGRTARVRPLIELLFPLKIRRRGGARARPAVSSNYLSFLARK